MRFWWPGRRTPILLMSLWAGRERGRVRNRAVQCGPAGGVGRGREGELRDRQGSRAGRGVRTCGEGDPVMREGVTS